MVGAGGRSAGGGPSAGGESGQRAGYGVEARPFRALLETMGIRLDDGSGEARLGVVLVDGYQRAELAAYNAESLRDGRPWLLVRPVGRQIWIGPLFRPGVTGVLGVPGPAAADKLGPSRPISRAGAAVPTAAGDDLAASPATLQAALGLAANAVATWIVRGELPELEGKVQTLDLTSLKAEAHTLVRLPYCPACGGHAE